MPRTTRASGVFPTPELRKRLHDVCAAADWIDALTAAAPHPDGGALATASDTAVRALTPDGVQEAIDGHAVIGKPRPDAQSRREQSRVSAAGEDVKARLEEANEAYRERFGQVFLICAAGRSPEEMLAALRERLANTPEAEQEVVREELRKINRLRLEKLVADGDAAELGLIVAPSIEPPSVSTHILDTTCGRPAAAVPVEIAARSGDDDPWTPLGGSATDEDGRCRDLPAPPPGTTAVRLRFDTGAYQRRRGAEPFFPEVTLVFAVAPGQHYHVPLLLNPFGYSVYRGS